MTDHKASNEDAAGAATIGATTMRSATLLFASAQIVGGLFNLVAGVVIARVLGPAEAGVWTFALWLTTLLVTCSSLGLPGAAAVFVAEQTGGGREDEANSLSRNLFAITAVASPAGAAVCALVLIYGRSGDYTTAAALLLSCCVVLAALGNTLVGVLRGRAKFPKILMANIAAATANLAVVFFSLFGGWGLVGFAAAFAAYNFVLVASAGLGVIATRPGGGRVAPVSPELRARVKRYLGASSLVVILELVIWDRSESLFLSIFSSDEQLAYYNIPYGVIKSTMTILPGSIVAVLLPKIAELSGRGDRSGMLRSFQGSIIDVVLVASVLAVVGAVVAGPFVRIVYGQEYSGMAPVLVILCVSGGLGVVVNLATACLFALEHQRRLLRMCVCVAAFNLGVGSILVYQFGAVGAAAADLTTQFVACVFWFRALVSLESLRFPKVRVAKILLVPLTAGLSAVIASSFSTSDVAALLVACSAFTVVGAIGMCSSGLYRDVPILRRTGTEN